ncbi:hypothetical protein D5018_00760 [Parashewanella curva]|uniref:Uncharacterized protein n=1 Tax=Parashewanella curva TaxID=2338552 RepID=A0A3L8Q215_9GAMM|nr:hypothetical protein [Parashewanella curva]RLV61681.1 hypothetical protein D5018_00760 [Parashewanella curva]
MSFPLYKRPLQEQAAHYAWLEVGKEHFHYNKDGGVSVVVDRDTNKRGNKQSAYSLEFHAETKAFTVNKVAGGPQSDLHHQAVIKAFLEEGIAAASPVAGIPEPQRSTVKKIKAYESRESAKKDSESNLLEDYIVCDGDTVFEHTVSATASGDDTGIELPPIRDSLARQQELVKAEDLKRVQEFEKKDEFISLDISQPGNEIEVIGEIEALDPNPTLKSNLESFLETDKGKKAKEIVKQLFTLSEVGAQVHEKYNNSNFKLFTQAILRFFGKETTEWTASPCICPFTGEKLKDDNAIQLRLHRPDVTDPTKDAEEHWVTVSRVGLRRYLLSMHEGEQYESVPADFSPEHLTEEDIREVTADNINKAQRCQYRFNDHNFVFREHEFHLTEHNP